MGAAISKISGVIDVIQSTESQTITQIVEKAKKLAIERATTAGAKPETVTLAEVDAIPLQYVANQVRVIARAVGEFSVDGLAQVNGYVEDSDDEEIYDEEATKEHVSTENEPFVDIDTYRPKVVNNPDSGIPEWFVSEIDVEWIADGCYVSGYFLIQMIS